jgi:hypothetical protein
MKKLFLLCFFSLIVNTAYTQRCGETSHGHIPITTPHAEPGVWVNVYYHLVKRLDGSGNTVTNADLCNATRDINTIFNKYGIYIKQIGFDEILNNDIYSFDGSASASNVLFSTNLRHDAVNIYIVPLIAAPCAKGIPSLALAVSESVIQSSPSILAHEMGHCFGLYHTHETFFGEEQINGSNGTTAGDKISDTAADPDLNGKVNNNCVYVGSLLQNGQPFAPDPRNIMSNSQSACLNKFSPLQVNVMYNTILGRNGLTVVDYFEEMRAAIAASDLNIPFINGENTVCSSAYFSASNIGFFIPTWSSSNTSVATIHRRTGYLKKMSDGFTTIKATITDGCSQFSIVKEIYVGKPPLVEGTYTYGSNTYPVNNPSTGIAVSSATPNIYINLAQSTPNLSYSWNITSIGNTSGGSVNSYLSPNGNQASIYLARSNYMNIDCKAVNICGSSPIISFNCYNYSYYQIIASPNPASQNLSITSNLVEDISVSNRSEPLLKTRDVNKTPIKLLDGNNRVIASGKLTNGTFECRLANVPNGTYYLQISEGVDLITRQIIVHH